MSTQCPPVKKMMALLRTATTTTGDSEPPVLAPSLQEIESHIRCRCCISMREATQQCHNSMAALSSPLSSMTCGNLFFATSQNNNSQKNVSFPKAATRNDRTLPSLHPFEKTNPDIARGKFGVDCV